MLNQLCYSVLSLAGTLWTLMLLSSCHGGETPDVGLLMEAVGSGSIQGSQKQIGSYELMIHIHLKPRLDTVLLIRNTQYYQECHAPATITTFTSSGLTSSVLNSRVVWRYIATWYTYLHIIIALLHHTISEGSRG